MANNGDDCYFFYYSTCAKGDDCPFRHCEAAMGNETVCSLWKEGRCFRNICKFRHMEITKNRKEIQCYWENQPAGCQKPHCAFFHEKARYIDGVFVPPNKSMNKSEETPVEEPPLPPTAPIPTAANPQLRGVKTESQEPVPSPTHPPVVINPADDDEDEDDQFSEEGEDGRGGPSPRKLPKSGNALNFGVSTLEEIRLRKALKASMKRAGYPLQSSETLASGEKENLQALFRPSLYEAREGPLAPLEETGRTRVSMAERLGRKMPNIGGEGVLLKKSLSERLGKIVDEEETKKDLKPIRERLGLPAAPVAPPHQAEPSAESTKAPEQIRIKTLEEIRLEKAAKCQSQNQGGSPPAADPETTTAVASKAKRGAKRAITVKNNSIGHIKTYSEILQSKKRKEDVEQQEKVPGLKKTKNSVDRGSVKDEVEPKPAPEIKSSGEIRVKTLEEIRREKAARSQAPSSTEAGNSTNSDGEESRPKKPRLLRTHKPAPEIPVATTEKKTEVDAKPQKNPAPVANPTTNNNVKVKTFEEIMREKRLRKQEMEEQEKALAESSPKPTADTALARNADELASVTSSSSPSPPSTNQTPDATPVPLRLPVRKRIPLRAKDPSPPDSTASPAATVAAVAAVASVPVRQSSSPLEQESNSQSSKSSRDTANKAIKDSAALSVARPVPAADQTPTANQKKSPDNTKVKPKVNVRPSVVKPAAQVKPGQKRKGAQRSAVAAVKPLNSVCAEAGEPQPETTCTDEQASAFSGTQPQPSSALPCSPSCQLDSSSSPLREEQLQTTPVFKKKTPNLETTSASNGATNKEPCAVPQSPVQKTPTQAKARRQSSGAASRAASAAAATTAMDDFEQLMNEFTDDHMEDDDMDPGIGEDDLLQELSEMIDS